MRWLATLQLALGLGALFGLGFFAVERFVGPPSEVQGRQAAQAEARQVAAEVALAWDETRAGYQRASHALAETAVFRSLAANFAPMDREGALRAALTAAADQLGPSAKATIVGADGRALMGDPHAALLAALPGVKDGLLGDASVRLERLDEKAHLVAVTPVRGARGIVGALVLAGPLDEPMFHRWLRSAPLQTGLAILSGEQVVASSLKGAGSLSADAATAEIDGTTYALAKRVLSEGIGGQVSVVGLSPLAAPGSSPAVESARFLVLVLGGLAFLVAVVVLLMLPAPKEAAAPVVAAPPPVAATDPKLELKLPAKVRGPEPIMAPTPLPNLGPPMPVAPQSPGLPAIPALTPSAPFAPPPMPPMPSMPPQMPPIAFPEAPRGVADPGLAARFAQKTLPSHPAPPAAPLPTVEAVRPPPSMPPVPPAPYRGGPDPTQTPPLGAPSPFAKPTAFDAIAQAAMGPPPPPTRAEIENLPIPKGASMAEIAQRTPPRATPQQARPGPPQAPLPQVFPSTPYDPELVVPKGLENAFAEVAQKTGNSLTPASGLNAPWAQSKTPGGLNAPAPTPWPTKTPGNPPWPAAPVAAPVPLPGNAAPDPWRNPSIPALQAPFPPPRPARVEEPRDTRHPADRHSEGPYPIPSEVPRGEPSGIGNWAASAVPGRASEVPAPFDETHYRAVYDEFVTSKARLGEAVENITFEGFKNKLRTSEQQLLDRHGCRAVRFQVLVKDRTVSLRPQLVR